MAKYLTPSPRAPKSGFRESLLRQCAEWVHEAEIARKSNKPVPIRPTDLLGNPLTEEKILSMAAEYLVKNSR